MGDFLIAAPTIKILEQSTLPKFAEVFPADWGVWKENKKIFQLKWGPRIYVRSTDDPNYLEGMTLIGAWLDEAGQMSQEVWTNIQGRLSIAKGRCLFTTTPYSFGWFKREVWRKISSLNGVANETGDENYAGFNWASIENPAFPRDEYERMKASLPPAIFERRYNGKFTQLEGLVYPDFSEDEIVEPFVIPMHWERLGGMDFGHTNPTAILCIARDPEKDIHYVYKEFYKAESSLKQMADFIQDTGLPRVFADPQSAQLISELQRTYHLKGVVQADNEIDVGVQRLTTLFRGKRLKVFKYCQNLIEELESYHYGLPDREGSVKDKPVDRKNHACDALRYAFSHASVVRAIRGLDPLNTLPSKRRDYTGQVRRSDLRPDPTTGY